MSQKRSGNFVSRDMNRKAKVEFAIKSSDKPQIFWVKVLSIGETKMNSYQSG